jgi:hypothetical protein
MSMHKLSLCLCTGLLASACVVVADDDDGTTAGTSVSSTSAGTDDPSASTTASSTTDPSTTDGTSDGTTTDATTGATTGPDFGNCGWGATGEDDVPMGYVCGGDGEDPDGGFDIACPVDLDLTEGGDCGPLTGVGCCDESGNAWFCADPDGNEGPQLFTDSCG